VKETAKKVRLKRDVNVATIPIRRDDFFPNAYIIDLSLDCVPDHVWQDILDREWKASLRLWDRKLFVVGDKLRLVTTIDDIENKLDWVKQIIEETNRGVDEHNEEIKAIEAQAEEEQGKHVSEERMSIEAIRDSLRRVLGGSR
jgi:tRNA uridine 5-carbamoylmethylation protein Kti12